MYIIKSGASRDDDGDIDIYQVPKILRRNDFRGIIIPDHSPLFRGLLRP
ncbi:MAG: hypothetical protein GX791_02620 [Synergistaceae bacterium]|nr:hypothetical protein [Synergistaceae bacterium]